jgi:hypothetical protein
VAEKNGYPTKTGAVREFFHAGSLVGKALGSYTPQKGDDVDTNLPEPASEEIDIKVTLQ